MPDPTPTEAAFEQAKALFIRGLASLEQGGLEAAEQCFAASLALVPGRVSTLVNLAATQLALARPQQALDTTAQVLAAEPDNPEAWLHRGGALAQLGRRDEALASYRRLLALDHTLAAAWSHCGNLLRELMRPAEAAHAFGQAIAHGADPELNGYYLASVGAGAVPATAPRGYVEGLFDSYSSEFEGHLLTVLRYRAHTALADALRGLVRGRVDAALDLGCGTGLCGPLVRPMVERLVGVDLSSRMLERARTLGVYDALVQADLVDHLRSTAERFDLVLAADVFIYIGNLEALFDAAHRALRAGGLLCFSAEPASREALEFELRPSLRYAHSERYLRALAARHGFRVVRLLRQPIREEQGRPIEAWIACLERC